MNEQAIQAALWPGKEYEARSMGGFGERMQREREMRSITLEEIAESTKIGCRMLRALEEEDFEKLPGGIFNKGFVRAYAKFLGIDEEQAVTDFQAALLEKQQRQSSNGTNGLHPNSEVLSSIEANAYADKSPQPDQAAGFMRAAVIIVVLLGVGAIGWKFWPAKKSAEQTATASPASTTSQPAVTVVKTPADQTSTDAAQIPATSSEPQTIAGTDSAAAPEAGKFRLRIHARETSWVQITADGKVLMAGELSPSGTRSFQAAKEMVVVLGNAPGVELSYNGKPLPQFSDEQKTRTLTFTPEGLRQ